VSERLRLGADGGDVHEITLPRRRGYVRYGHRFAVVVQADDLLDLA